MFSPITQTNYNILTVAIANRNQDSINAYPYEWIHNDSFESNHVFNKFINWLSGEYILYLQDEHDGFSVFFPCTCFSIKELKLNKDIIKFSIIVKSKDAQKGELIFNEVEAILNHLKRIQRLK